MEKVLTKGLKGGRKLRKKIRYSAESKANQRIKNLCGLSNGGLESVSVWDYVESFFTLYTRKVAEFSFNGADRVKVKCI